jgi:hypothetical protein
MRLEELPDDILTQIFYYLKSPYNGLLVKNLYYIATNPFNTHEYLLLQSKGDPVMRGRWSSLTDRDWDFLIKRYSPYRLHNGIATPYCIKENVFLTHIRTLKYLKLKTLRMMYPHIKAKTKSLFIQTIMKI